MAVCENCPMAATLNAGEQLARESRLLDGEADDLRNRTLGGIAITRRSLEAVADNISCTRPFNSPTTGQIDCPLRESTYGARSFAFTPWNQAQWTIDLARQVNTAPSIDQTGQNTGQYL